MGAFNPMRDVLSRCENILCYSPSNRGGAMAMQCEEKPRLLRKIQIQTVAAELEKAEAKNLVEEVCKEVGSGYHVRYFKGVCKRWTGLLD